MPGRGARRRALPCRCRAYVADAKRAPPWALTVATLTGVSAGGQWLWPCARLSRPADGKHRFRNRPPWAVECFHCPSMQLKKDGARPLTSPHRLPPVIPCHSCSPNPVMKPIVAWLPVISSYFTGYRGFRTRQKCTGKLSTEACNPLQALARAHQHHFTPFPAPLPPTHTPAAHLDPYRCIFLEMKEIASPILPVGHAAHDTWLLTPRYPYPDKHTLPYNR